MKTVAERKEYGECDLGYVFVHEFGGSPDDNGNPTIGRFEVRAGNHTVATKSTFEEADALARALVGLPGKEIGPAVDVPEEALGDMEEHVAAVRAKVSKKE